MAEKCGYCQFPLEPQWPNCPNCGRLRPSPDDTPPVPACFPPPGHTQPRTAAASKQIAFLVLKTGAEAVKTFQLGESTNIGRDPKGNQIVIDDPRVSRHHGRVRLENGSFFYHDLASSTGSRLVTRNGAKRKISGAVRLVNGDVLQLGGTKLAFMEVAE